MKKFIEISQMEIAARQLETAITLFFYDFDVVSVHTITCAAHGILKDLARKKKIKSEIEQAIDNHINEDRKKEFIKQINMPKNSFKHADDQNTTASSLVEFCPEQSEIFIYDACTLYKLLTGKKTPLIRTYEFWFFSKNPHLIKIEKQEAIKRVQKDFDLKPEIKSGYLKLLKEYESKYKA